LGYESREVRPQCGPQLLLLFGQLEPQVRPMCSLKIAPSAATHSR
jgi:hypothetical protein